MKFSAATVGAASAMLLVGTSTAISATVADFPVFTGQALRYALAAVILFAVLRQQRPPRVRLTVRDALLLVALAATGLAGFNLFLVEATRHAGPAMIGTVIGAVPLVMALAGPLMERRRPTPRAVGAALVVALGTAVAAGLGSGSAKGLLLSLGALAGEVAFSLLAVPLLPKLGPLRVAAYPAALAVPILLATGLALEGTDALRIPTPSQAAAFAYLGAIVTAAAFFLWYDALRRLGADRAGLFAGLVPVGALLTAVTFGLGQAGPADVVGALLVAAGVVFGQRRAHALSAPNASIAANGSPRKASPSSPALIPAQCANNAAATAPGGVVRPVQNVVVVVLYWASRVQMFALAFKGPWAGRVRSAGPPRCPGR
ncbi:DMT family transporter [Streptomyces sp. NBC_00247]|uniref:DMT family transporter n=1 Tax=Streptomyces sp. NBC_00247 TaxID=2975689 RepID=UPI002E2D1144|nr:DMT family transporter [Streptomyces sp. NBC_00247]